MSDSDNTPKKADNVEPLRPTRPCPICKKPSQRKFYPFCSKRCADVDLNRWLTGAYAIPVVEEDHGFGGDDPVD
ncbi:hypothetical protein GGD81_004092 [Rhodobium orientis]|uniref:DNA gyrase inhibitor YacG n=1 Tax=Rhodobium orientis TaxID=34017 RepID=A0A327JJH1_9HYPH|nr:DNA gyrase inhibitor YacG [Rhodobium orientis]MBB4305026.1 hypothetical protein [Rhodobium orientis]MBK5948767.1 DNA gyrase inhibitor YacG [Rhodobium orientis]RAI26469.1 DNA gyrase inhibitor YacG [Rhodobium orientis]